MARLASFLTILVKKNTKKESHFGIIGSEPELFRVGSVTLLHLKKKTDLDPTCFDIIKFSLNFFFSIRIRDELTLILQEEKTGSGSDRQE